MAQDTNHTGRKVVSQNEALPAVSESIHSTTSRPLCHPSKSLLQSLLHELLPPQGRSNRCSHSSLALVFAIRLSPSPNSAKDTPEDQRLLTRHYTSGPILAHVINPPRDQETLSGNYQRPQTCYLASQRYLGSLDYVEVERWCFL